MRGREKKREKSWFSYLRTLIQRRSFGVPFYLNGSSFIPALECATATSSKINTTSLPRRSIFLVSLKRRNNPNLEFGFFFCFFLPKYAGANKRMCIEEMPREKRVPL